MSAKLASKSIPSLAIGKLIKKDKKTCKVVKTIKCAYQQCEEDIEGESACRFCKQCFCYEHLDPSRTDFCMHCTETDPRFCEDCVSNYLGTDICRMHYKTDHARPFHAFKCKRCAKKICSKCTKYNDDFVRAYYCFECFECLEEEEKDEEEDEDEEDEE